MKMKLLIISLMFLILTMPMGYAYAWDSGNDNADRLSNGSSNVFSPGYINAAKQQAYSIVNQSNQNKGWWNNLVNTVKNKVSNKVEEQANTKVQPEIKKKTSSKATSFTRTIDSSDTAITTSTGMVDSANYDVPIGTGTDQRDINGNLVTESGGQIASEIINGTRHHYVGFDGGYTTIQSGIDAAGVGDFIIVIGMTGTSEEQWSSAFSDPVNINKSITLLGGYNPDGTRDYENYRTTIKGTINVPVLSGDLTPFEINGFTIYSINGITISGESTTARATIANNTFKGAIGIVGYLDGATVRNNIFNSQDGVDGVGTYTLSGNTFYGLGVRGAGSPTNVFSYDNNYNGTADIIGVGSLQSEGDWGLDILIGSTSNITDPAINQNAFVADSQMLGTITTSETVTTTQTITEAGQAQLNPFSSNYHGNLSNQNIYGSYFSSPFLNPNQSNALTSTIRSNTIGQVLKALMNNKGTLEQGMAIPLNEAIIGRLVTGTLASAVGVPGLTAPQAQDMQIAMALANILKNPTADQKAVLDAAESLLADMKNIQEKAGANPELTKAESDLLQMVANVLLAQGVPDLLKAGDIEGVKGIFKDLGQSKDKIILGYNESIKPYYSNMVKELEANMALLQTKGILSKKLTEEELRNFEPKELDRIIESIRKSNDKSFELEYILQQDVKYKKQYLEPQNKALEEAMKTMMKSFTKKISTALEERR